MRVFTYRLIWMAVLAIHAGEVSAQIQYTEFGPATLNTNDSFVFLTGLNQLIAFSWTQPSAFVRRGLIEFTGSGVSLLTSSGSMVVLGEGDAIDAGSGNWTSASGQSTLWEYDFMTGFNSSYLQPSNVGIIPLRFEENSEFYYGWVEVTNIANDGSSYTISAFAYNAQPDAPIQAGQSEDPPPGGGGNGGGNGGGGGDGVVPEPSTAALVALGFLMWMLAGFRSVAFARSGGCR